MMSNPVLLLALFTATSAFAGASVISQTVTRTEVSSPRQSFSCIEGDGGYRPTIVQLNAQSLPDEVAYNFRSDSGIIVQTSGHAPVPCAQFLKHIADEISKFGGKLPVLIKRSAGRWAMPDFSRNACKLYLTENITVRVGKLDFNGSKVTYVQDLPQVSPLKCREFVPSSI